jgi:hypothetical protein
VAGLKEMQQLLLAAVAGNRWGMDNANNLKKFLQDGIIFPGLWA